MLRCLIKYICANKNFPFNLSVNKNQLKAYFVPGAMVGFVSVQCGVRVQGAVRAVGWGWGVRHTACCQGAQAQRGKECFGTRLKGNSHRFDCSAILDLSFCYVARFPR